VSLHNFSILVLKYTVKAAPSIFMHQSNFSCLERKHKRCQCRNPALVESSKRATFVWWGFVPGKWFLNQIRKIQELRLCAWIMLLLYNRRLEDQSLSFRIK